MDHDPETLLRIPPTAPCWCGSGLRFKDCQCRKELQRRLQSSSGLQPPGLQRTPEVPWPPTVLLSVD
ncbi:MAG: SEC-C domain-containing protein [Bacillota bacterium]